LHSKDKALLYLIRDTLALGNVRSRSDSAYCLEVVKIEDLLKLINYFDKYPLITQKQVDFFLFKKVVKLIVNKEHLTKEGLIKIINIKAAMNFGVLPDTLKAEFKVNPDPVMDEELMKTETKRIPDIN
jgi:hypothetical protein